MTVSIFVSYASADRNYVERLVGFLESHHLSCWVSFRDVGVGENYQEAITRALRAAKILIVFVTRHANSSGEIQKELSLASRYNLVVIPLRMEDVEPNDALAYELATRQWVDMFRNWDAGCERLLSQLSQLAPSGDGAAPPRPAATLVAPATAPRRPMPAGSVFVPPRQPIVAPWPGAPGARPAAAGTTPPAAPATAGDWPRTVPPPAAVAPAGLHSQPDPQMPAAASRIIGLLSFLLFAASFGVVLSNAMQRAQTPYFELVFWAILLFGCARLFAAILRAMVRVVQQPAASGG